MLIVGAVHFRRAIIAPLPGSEMRGERGLAADMCSWDGDWYARIVSVGYDFAPGQQCSIVYFPAYPLIARGLRAIIGFSPELSLLITSNAFLIAAMVLFRYYLKQPRALDRDRAWPRYAVLSLAFFPTTFFFRMGYTEAALLFFLILAMLGMRRRWHPLVVALIIGMATATRSVGIALALPYAVFLWESVHERIGRPDLDNAAQKRRPTSYVIAWGLRCMLLFPIACWGLLAFMAYQRLAFGSAFAFAEAQRAWHVRASPAGILGSLGSWFSGEPLWSTYVPGSPCFWGHEQPVTEPFLNLAFANPIYFTVTAALATYGVRKKWVTVQEALLCLGLLCIPYFLQTGRQGMISEARFAAVAFPVYTVMGRMLARIPWPVAAYALLCSAAVMATYAMLFASGYDFF
jgi:hypothetical protein